jgi:hypothetical protein
MDRTDAGVGKTHDPQGGNLTDRPEFPRNINYLAYLDFAIFFTIIARSFTTLTGAIQRIDFL